LLTVATASVLGAQAAGAVAELPLVSSGSDDGTMYTKAAVDAAIAAAIGGISFGDTGDLCASMRASKSNWLLLNGQTIGGITSGATYAHTQAQNLFNLFWAINAGTWPIQTNTGAPSSHGASALIDWNASKRIPLPDARGASIGMLDLSAGINPLLLKLGLVVGDDTVSLDITNMAPHVHDGGKGTGTAGSGGGTGFAFAVPGKTGMAGGVQQGSASASTVSGTTLTVAGTLTGKFAVGQMIIGTPGVINIADGATILSQLTGTPGGLGTYQLSLPSVAPLGPGIVTAYGAAPINVTQPTMGANIFIKL
jgi:hypothetical protein